MASQIVLNPFQIFIKDLVSISYSILELERGLPTIKSSPINVNGLDEDDKVAHQSPDGQLKVGFAEDSNPRWKFNSAVRWNIKLEISAHNRIDLMNRLADIDISVPLVQKDALKIIANDEGAC